MIAISHFFSSLALFFYLPFIPSIIVIFIIKRDIGIWAMGMNIIFWLAEVAWWCGGFIIWYLFSATLIQQSLNCFEV